MKVLFECWEHKQCRPGHGQWEGAHLVTWSSHTAHWDSFRIHVLRGSAMKVSCQVVTEFWWGEASLMLVDLLLSQGALLDTGHRDRVWCHLSSIIHCWDKIINKNHMPIVIKWSSSTKRAWKRQDNQAKNTNLSSSLILFYRTLRTIRCIEAVDSIF